LASRSGLIFLVGATSNNLQYREVREYVCEKQDSRYELTYRYNRIV
jgi:hypothetical protein